MSFASVSFAILFGIVFLGRCVIGREKRGRTYFSLLLVGSLVFYAWHIPLYLLLLFGVAGLNFFVAGQIGTDSGNRRVARRWVSLAVIGSLGALAVFKYTGFALRSVKGLWVWAGGSEYGWHLELALPIGISFYTFQALSYVIDVYRGQLKHRSSFFEFLLYVSFFPQLVAGPIVRAKDFFYQWNRRRGLRWTVVSEGCFQLIGGFFLKLVIADGIAEVVDSNWGNRAAVNGVLGIGGLSLLFGGQIFADFAGYSMIARGLGYLLGFRLPVNFDAPYIAMTLQEFWRRWHISLSTWLRDYLYVPLGGNRGGRSRTMRNVFLVMLLGGLWHGAGAPFVIWGAIHGGGLLIEKGLGIGSGGRLGRAWCRGLWFVVTQGFVFLAWLVFRMESFEQMVVMVDSFFRDGLGLGSWLALSGACVYLLPIFALHVRRWLEVRWGVKGPGVFEKAALAGGMLALTFGAYSQGSAFIYFEF